MKSSQPPSLATWLLEHLLPRGGNEPLAGDLSEGYSQGRSAAWYWRQVLVAIMVGFSKELRARWVTLMFAAIVSSALPWKPIWHSSEFQFVIVWGTRLPWPASFFFSVVFLSVFEAVVLLVAVSAYLRAIRSFNLRSFFERVVDRSSCTYSRQYRRDVFVSNAAFSAPFLLRCLAIASVLRSCSGNVGSASKRSRWSSDKARRLSGPAAKGNSDMRHSPPPNLATWLLKNFGTSRMNDCLIGDLMEEYGNGRSDKRWALGILARFYGLSEFSAI